MAACPNVRCVDEEPHVSCLLLRINMQEWAGNAVWFEWKGSLGDEVTSQHTQLQYAADLLGLCAEQTINWLYRG
jgi:hypothetical protein